jgi:precorrin-6B methylase 2
MPTSFDPHNPFPLLSLQEHTFEETKTHAIAVDEWLGMRTAETEQIVYDNERYNNDSSSNARLAEMWRGIPIQLLQTPYIEIRAVLNGLGLKAGETVVDLGSAYGRMAHIIGSHHPGVQFVGYECVSERVEESRRCLQSFTYSNVRIEEADLSALDFRPQEADVYFMYDFGSRSAIEKTLNDLKSIAATRRLTVIGRGRTTRQLIETRHPWLSGVHEPEHHAGYSIYHSAPRNTV